MFRAGVVGSPVAHSLSPSLHQAAFDFLNIRGESRRFDVGFDDVTGLTQALERDALSVTTPLKEVVGRYCTMSETAQRIGAVNSESVVVVVVRVMVRTLMVKVFTARSCTSLMLMCATS